MTKKRTAPSSKQNHESVSSDDNEHFLYTFDLGLSAALVSTNFSLSALERGDLRKTRFVFRRSDGVDEVVDAYWSDRLEVKARTYFDTLKMLKNRLYSE